MSKKNFYELTYIINPVLEENQTKEIVDKYNTFLKENGATIDQICAKLELEGKQARSTLDRLRTKGYPVERIGKCQFRSPAAKAKAPTKRKSH